LSFRPDLLFAFGGSGQHQLKSNLRNQETIMKSKFGGLVIFTPVLFFVFTAFMLSQKSPASKAKPVQTEAVSLNQDLTSQEAALQQSHHTMAVIYREMAVANESDSASVRDLKRHYERLAENEEKAAAAHARLATFISQAAPATQRRSVIQDSAYRK
jgi:hypothetical protein